MTLDKHIYRAFEDVVGKENISDNPVILDSYARRSGLCSGPDNFTTRFEAVILPSKTKEIQAIIKICNRFKIQFKASSTGWAFFSDPSRPGVVKLDLKRMNRIIEINEKNMYAVVEPYVIGAQLQAELMKRGFNCNLTGAGSNCSALPLAAHENIGHMGQTTSYGERNQLAMEWVTPEGDLIRLGSLGCLGEWFCGDGPGPSIRGVLRGSTTPLGGLGVYTKAAMKIYHWSGPPEFPVGGISPNYAPDSLPQGFMIRYLSFPTKEDRFDALRKIGESEIAFEIMGFTPSMLSANMATSNDEDVKLMKQIRKSVQGPGFQVIVIGNSKRDFNYKERVLYQIMEETRGKSLELLENPKIGGAQLWRCIRITGSIRETLRATGVFSGIVGGTDLVEQMSDFIESSLDMKEDLIRKRLVYNDGAETFLQTMEHGHYGHAELLLRFFADPKNMEGIGGLMMQSNENVLNKHLPVPHHVSGDDLIDLYGSKTSNFNKWLRKIKRSFDPKGISEATNYITDKSAI